MHEGRTDHLELENVEDASHFILDEQPERTLEFFSKRIEVGGPSKRLSPYPCSTAMLEKRE